MQTLTTGSSSSSRLPLWAVASFIVFAAAFISVGPANVAGQEAISLAAGFQNPPKFARPSAYYLLLNGYVNRDHVEHELRQLHEVGIRGLCVFDMGARGAKEAFPPVGPAFMSPEWLDNFAHVVRQAARLDMDVQLAACSSWDLGASWVRPQDASMALYHSSIVVEGPAEFTGVLPLPEISKNAPRDKQGRPVFLKNVAVLAFPQGAASADKPTIGSLDSIFDLTDKLDSRGRLDWKIPSGEWTILRFVCANTGELLKVPSPASNGLATDHFSSRVTSEFIEDLTGRLEQRLGDLKQSPLKQLYLPSYEVRGAIWTPDFPERFRQYRGYDLTPYLPAIIGYEIEDKEITDRFLYDFRKTLGDLLVDAYYKTASKSAARFGLGIEAESGGPGPPVHQVPVDALKALGAIDEMRGEFWPWRTQRDELWVVKETACAAHIYGHSRVHMEAFTGFRHWEDGPFDLKPSADRAFCEGMNHVVWHTSAHQPPEAGKPGWVYGAGTHFMPNLIWWPMAKPFVDYLSRCSFLLQQGHFVADVCYYYGDQGYNFVPPKHIDPSLGFGYDYDVVNAEVLQARMSVEDHRLVLPHGMSYRLLVLPEREDIDPEVLEKIADLVKAGATVVGPKPTRSTGLAAYRDNDRKVRRLADLLWADCDGKTVLEHQYGKGRIIWGRSLKHILSELGVGPDLVVQEGDNADLDWIHRRTPAADIYFVRNKTMHSKSVDVCFRVFGRSPELWSADTGEIAEQFVYEQTDRGVCVPLRFDPVGSVFVVFRRSGDGPHLTHADPELTVDKVREDEVRITVGRSGSYQVKTSDGRAATCEINSVPSEMQLTGPWKVSFPAESGGAGDIAMAKLTSWTEHEDHKIRHFSGIARYKMEFEPGTNWFGDNRRLYLDLGRLWCVAEIFVNHQSLGVVWKPPYRVDVTDAVKPGGNVLEVKVANTWANRLVGDSKLPEEERFCRTNITRSGTPGRPWRDVPLRQSGLLGPVKLVVAVEKKITLARARRHRVE